MYGEKKFLKTIELSLEIIRIISEARSYCYIVSPYVKLWPQLERTLQRVSKDGLHLTFVIRQSSESDGLVKKLNVEFGFEVIVIRDIHIKLYLNERTCLLSTMNLYSASQSNNLELGYLVDDHRTAKNEILDKYILQDHTAVRHPGSFESGRVERETQLNEYNARLNGKGFCVDCSGQIDGDFNQYRPYVIRCKNCFDKCENRYDEIKYCHYCGQSHDSNGKYPLHEQCHIQLRIMRDEMVGVYLQ